MKIALLVLAVCAAADAYGQGTNHCCKTKDNPIISRLVSEERTKIEQYMVTETITSIKGYRPCRAGEKPLLTRPATMPTIPPLFSRRPIIIGGFTRPPMVTNLAGMLASAKPEDFLDCPDIETTERQVPAYRVVKYTIPVYKVDDCADKDVICCEGYYMIDKSCHSEKNAEDHQKGLDFLAKLGLIG